MSITIKAIATKSVIDTISYAATLVNLLERKDFYSAVCNAAGYKVSRSLQDNSTILYRTNANLLISRSGCFIAAVDLGENECFTINIMKEAFQIELANGQKFGMTFNQVMATNLLEETLITGDFLSARVKDLDIHHAICRGLEIFALAVTQSEEV